MILGRVSKGKAATRLGALVFRQNPTHRLLRRCSQGGDIMLDTAKKVLQEEFPQFSHIQRFACTESHSGRREDETDLRGSTRPTTTSRHGARELRKSERNFCRGRGTVHRRSGAARVEAQSSVKGGTDAFWGKFALGIDGNRIACPIQRRGTL